MLPSPELAWRHARSSQNPVALVRLMGKRSRLRGSGGSRNPLPLYNGGSDVPLAVLPAAHYVAAEQLVRKVPQALFAAYSMVLSGWLIMRKREVFS
jgi:hypothetical protein